MKMLVRGLAVGALSLLTAGAASADGAYPWNNHKSPNTFLFGNDIDTHQQSKLNSDASLSGYLYIWFTGAATSDGFQVATHMNCNMTPGCTAGWTLHGLPGTGTFLYMTADQNGVMDHPVFLVYRTSIPEPGAYAHFHWLNGMPGAGQLASGYFLQLTSVAKFCFFHMPPLYINPAVTCEANKGIPVVQGIDIATHVNIVTSYQ